MASKESQLEQRIAELENILRLNGILPREARDASSPRPDRIEFGSDAHLAFLGLSRVTNVEQAQAGGITVYSSPDTAETYSLIDEVAAVQRYRGMDPEKAILFELRQKVNVFEAGPPQPPADCPPMFSAQQGMSRVR